MFSESSMTGFFWSEQNPFYKFKVVAKTGDLGIKEIKREVSINDKGQIAFAGSGFEEDWTVISHTTQLKTVVKEDHVFAFDDQFGLRDLSEKVILATAGNPEYGISKPNVINSLTPLIKNPARTFDIFRTSYISPGTDASDSSSGIQINNNGDIIVRRFEISGGWTFLGLKKEDFGVYPFHYWTPEPNKYASFLETWSASNPSAAQSPKLISQGFIPSYLYIDTYSPVPILPLIPLRVYEPDFAAQANKPSINNKGEVVFRAFGPDNWIAIHDPSNPVIKPQVQDANMYKAKVPDLDFNVWSSDNNKFLKSSSKSLEVFNKQFDFQQIGSQFSSFGNNSRISDDGSIVTFYADGEIWAAIDLPQGTGSPAKREYVKVAGLSGNGLLDPGENNFDFNLNGILDDGEYEDGIFSRFEPLSVVAVNSTHIDEKAGDDTNNNGSIDKGRDEFTVVFIGYDLNGNKGIYSNRVALFDDFGDWQAVPTTPTLVAEVGMSLAGLDGTITDIDIYDPVNNYDKGDIAFWVKTATGQTAVIKSRRQEVLYMDFDPQRSTASGFFSDDIGRLSSMGSLLQDKLISSAYWDGNLDTYITKASQGNRSDLINNLQQIKDQLIATVQSRYNDVGANVVVTDKRPTVPGQYKYLSIGDILGESKVRAYFDGDSRNQQIGRSDSGRFFNFPILHGAVFVDRALDYGEFVGLYKDSAGRSETLPVDLSQLNNSSLVEPLFSKFPVYKGYMLQEYISKDILVKALSQTISHEFGHSLGLYHLDPKLDPTLVVPKDGLIMEKPVEYQTSTIEKRFSTTTIPLAEVPRIIQNDKQRLGQSVGSDSKFQRDPFDLQTYVEPPSSDLSELKDPGFHNRSAFFSIFPYLNPLFNAEVKAGTVLSILEVLPDPDGYLSPVVVDWELSDDGENWKLAAQMTDQYIIRPEDIGKQIRAVYSYIDGRGLHVSNFISGSLADDQTSLDIAAISAGKAEGNSGTTAYTFIVKRNGDISGASSATWTVSGSGANPATTDDIIGGGFPAGIVFFAPDETIQTITINVVGDIEVEPDETFTVSLSDPSGATLDPSDSVASGTILNDDVNDGTAVFSIFGSPAVGQTLSATNTTPDPDGNGDVGFSYDWQTSTDGSTWNPVGTNSPSYLVASADQGKQLRLVVSYTDGQGFPESVTTAAGTVGTINDGAATFSISGTPAVGNTFTATNSALDPDGNGTFSYSWQTSTDGSTWNPVGTNSPSYLVASADQGKQLRLVVSYTDGQGFPESVTTPAGTVGTINDGAATFSISGTPAVGNTFTATNSALDPDGNGTFSYSWQTSTDGSTWNPVGTNSPSYLVASADQGKQLRLVVSYTDGQGFLESVTTVAGSVPILPPPPTPSIGFSASPSNQAEGNIGSTPYSYSITRSGDLSQASSVFWEALGSGANPATAMDFTGGILPTGILTFQPGQDTLTVVVNVVGDTTLEANEGFDIVLSAPTNAVLASARSTASSEIVNDDQPGATYSFTATPDPVYEGNLLAIGVSTTNVAPGTPVFWQFSGTGISGADFSDGQLTGNTVIGMDGRAAFTKRVAADGDGVPDEILELRFFTDSSYTQQVGSTTTITLKVPNLGGATDDNDIIIGTAAAESISGVPVGSALRGRGSLDHLTGNGSAATFVLGDAFGLYYDDGTPGLGTTDLAVVTDFTPGDRIQLFGANSDYRLVSGRYSRVPGVRIDALNGSTGGPEAIGFVQGATLATLNLSNPSQFLFV